MLSRLKIKYKWMFDFNEFNRDLYIKEIASQIPEGSKVLDAGAGTCKYRNLFNHCSYKTQDFGCYKADGHEYGSLDYICDITSIPVNASSFDFIICTEVLEHLKYPELAIKEFERILRKDGELIITSPLGSGIHQSPYHFYGGFTPFWYNYFLPKYNFIIVSCLPNCGFFKHYGQESQRLVNIITPKKRIAKLFFVPFKMLLFIGFKFLIPIICHYLDKVIQNDDFTVGYFVRAKKK
jgi:ubiquinone/menaquinone biosynthesis C-methylase UbiE